MASERHRLSPDTGPSQRPINPALNLPALEVSSLLRKYGLNPHKGLGQNFLADPAALVGIVHAADLPPNAAVLEIGPGLGSLTRLIAQVAARVVAVELDQSIFPALQEVVGGFAHVSIVHGDILEIDPAALMGEDGYFVVANIPYYITSAVIRHLLEARVRPQRIVLTVQREVAERICAQPNDMSLLALSVQVYGKPTIAAHIPASAFIPPPKVDSSVVRVDLYPEPVIPALQLDIFFKLARAGFSQKRKTLRNSLSGGLSWPTTRVEALLAQAAIDPRRRAETLSLQEWKDLTLLYRFDASVENPSA